LFTLFREGRVIISSPPKGEDFDSMLPALRQGLRKWWWHFQEGSTPDSLVEQMTPVARAVIGPAFIGYAETVSAPAPAHHLRSLSVSDAAAIESLRANCDPTEWDHGGSSRDHVCSGVFESGELGALAGYEVWGGTIAHIAVVTHPKFRGRGFGRSAVAHLAQRALDVGLLPQYRTLESNAPSMRIAGSLGFERYATSVAVRI
jgi:GNAT superfamily N-acetyltransferase